MSTGPSPADDTRQRLVAAATAEFAQHGVHGASLLEISRRAGQRNRGAVHYHFGSRAGMLVAVLRQHGTLISAAEADLLAVARARPDDVDAAVRAFVLPAVSLAEQGGEGRLYLMIMADLILGDPMRLEPDVQETLLGLGGYEAYALLDRLVAGWIPEDDVRLERMTLATLFVLQAVADRARDDRPARPWLPVERFRENLVAMVAGMLQAPLPR
ncbi:TetR/AcrR family transcriptional regulator [Nocardioides sp.]|uniref:TetR/AcrR family transcriptional regulator n=1 Tax=Nocardioides sp. TaxID=35761 RepID=UPI00351409D0